MRNSRQLSAAHSDFLTMTERTKKKVKKIVIHDKVLADFARFMDDDENIKAIDTSVPVANRVDVTKRKLDSIPSSIAKPHSIDKIVKPQVCFTENSYTLKISITYETNLK